MCENLTIYRNPDPRYHVDFPAVTVAPNGDVVMLVRECGPWAREATFGFDQPLTFFEVDACMRILRSTDGGRTFVAGDTLCRGLAFDPMLCTLADGRLLAGLIVGQAGSRLQRASLSGVLHRHLPQMDTVITVRGIALRTSDDNGRTWSAGREVTLPGWENIYNLRKAFQLADGTVILPITVGYPWRSRYVGLLRSWDVGDTWADPSYVAEDPAGRSHYATGLGYWQPGMVATTSGGLVCVCVLDTQDSAPKQRPGVAKRGNLPAQSGSLTPRGILPLLYITYSQDSGFTWSAPQPTGLEGDYPSLTLLPSGRLLLTHTQRHAHSASVVAHLSADGGVTWRPAGVVREEERGLYHYAHTVVLPDGLLLTACMATPPDGVRVVQVIRWALGQEMA